MSWKSIYEKWKNFKEMDAKVKGDLQAIKSEEELEDSFYKNLEFGTAGMRGLLGAGTNRMNIYTVRKAALGLGRYVVENGEEARLRGVVIAYDSRHMSPEFALETARTIGALGVKVYLFESLRTTPELSFAVRYLHAYAGVVITASHNPSAYNGFKVYGEDGAQIASEAAETIVAHVDAIEDELTIEVADVDYLKEDDMLVYLGEQIDHAYITKLQGLIVNPDVIEVMADELRIVYTPLHGTGNRPVQEALKQAGFFHVKVVKEQEKADGNFPTVEYPNPEEASAFKLAMDYGKAYEADLLMATDPDADRVGIAVPKADGYTLLTGNQIGALLLHYLITEKEKQGMLKDNAVLLKTIVTSELGRDIAAAHGLQTIDTLTGFKYIAEKIKEFEETGEHSFLFGYEESYGYLVGDFVRDKDAVQTCLLIAEVAAFYKEQDMTLYDGLQAIFKEYGYYTEHLESLTLEGKSGSERIDKIMNDFRENPPASLADLKVTVREDYMTSERIMSEREEKETIALPTSNVLKYTLENGAWVCIRRLETEPKVEFYYGVKEATATKGNALIKKLVKSMDEKLSVFS